MYRKQLKKNNYNAKDLKTQKTNKQTKDPQQNLKFPYGTFDQKSNRHRKPQKDRANENKT